jgi:trans-aconitate 2-methyltransferase
VLPDASSIADWTRATTLLPYFERLPADLHEPFLDRYRQALRETLGGARPFFYTFRRILLHAERASPDDEA